MHTSYIHNNYCTMMNVILLCVTATINIEINIPTKVYFVMTNIYIKQC